MDNAQEFNFVSHLFTCIKDGLTGRNMLEFVGDGPRDRFHAGVLLPLAPELPIDVTEIEGVFDSLSSKDDKVNIERTIISKVDTESTMSIDFQIHVPEDTERFVMRIKPSFSVYYAVFPTLEEVLASQDMSQQEEIEEDTISDDSTVSGMDSADQEVVPDLDLIKRPNDQEKLHDTDSPLTQSTAKIKEAQFESVILPRKFRKHQVKIPAIEIMIDPQNLTPPLELRDPIDFIMANVRTTILTEDTDIWRHLGKPSDGHRELSGANFLLNDEVYNNALLSATKGDVAIPTWRAYLTITGQPTLLTSSVDRQILRINVALVNSTPSISKTEQRRAQLEECALFDCGFSIEVEDCELVPFEFEGTPKDYRYDRSFPAIGSNCIAMLDERNNISRLYTETVPLYEQPWYRTRNDLPVAFADLDDGPTSDLLGILDQLAQRMDSYLAEWDIYLNIEAPANLNIEQIKVCVRDRHNFAAEVKGFKLGIESLRKDANLLRAFSLMNRVFRENGQERIPPIESWRLFQLAFMVIQLPTLAARERDLRGSDEYTKALKTALERVDVLWFPTGGGKTEAYLGLITTALFYDRLRGKSRGVSAWMRFPLRMLSLQQLERLSRVLARAEIIRSTERDLRSIGGDPFAIGYYVGAGNTPNRITESDLPKGSNSEKYWERLQIIRYCPFCNSSVGIKFNQTQWRLVHYCHNPQCYSNTSQSLREYRGSLPIFVVDNEIYRYRPSVLVGTVDKLAVLGFQKHFAHLISEVSQRCPSHGYASFGKCIESGAGPCKVALKDFDRLQPDKDPVPAFLIQDELHLLKEELGTFNAHYEGFLQYIASKQNHKPSKILAATATIEAYEAQIYHLYLKEANRFPQPSWRAGESFYATSTPVIYRRLYSGILTHQRNSESAALRTLELYNRKIQWMRDQPKEALEELGINNVTVDNFLDFLRLYDLSLTYVNRKATGGNIAYGLYQIVSPQLSRPLSVSTLTGDNTMIEVGQVIEKIELERNEVEGQRLDVLIATSLISHGVDLERINFLAMVGMPSKYAEYIQASSRAARNHVGLVMVCFKRSDLRERSQYHYFLPNHRYLDRLVESVSINRYSSFAAKRTVPGLIVGLLLSYYSRVLFSRKQITKPLDNMRELHKMIASGEISIEQLNDDLQHIIGVHHPKLSDMQRQYVIDSITQALQTNWDQILRSFDSQLRDAIHPMLSFRDVDETLDFIADGPSSAFVDRIRST